MIRTRAPLWATMCANSAGAKPCVERHQHHADGRKAEECFEVTVAVGREKGDPISRSNTQRDKSSREAAAAIGQLAVRQPAFAVDDSDAVAEARAGMFEWIGQRDHFVWNS